MEIVVVLRIVRQPACQQEGDAADLAVDGNRHRLLAVAVVAAADRHGGKAAIRRCRDLEGFARILQIFRNRLGVSGIENREVVVVADADIARRLDWNRFPPHAGPLHESTAAQPLAHFERRIPRQRGNRRVAIATPRVLRRDGRTGRRIRIDLRVNGEVLPQPAPIRQNRPDAVQFFRHKRHRHRVRQTMAETDTDAIAEALLAEFVKLLFTRLFRIVPDAHDNIARHGFHQRFAHLRVAVAGRDQLVMVHDGLHAKRFHKLNVMIDFVQKLLQRVAVFAGVAFLPFAEDELVHADMEVLRLENLDRLADGVVRQLPPQRLGEADRVVPCGVVRSRITRNGRDVRHVFRMGAQP